MKNPLLTTCLLPVLGMMCLARAFGNEGKPQVPPRFEKEIQSFESADAKQFPPPGAIVCIGSSSMGGWHSRIAQDLAPLTIIPRGFGGSKMNDALHYADRIVIPYKPRAVVVYEGDNDIAGGIAPEKVRDTFRLLVEAVHKPLPETRFYFLSIKPSIKRWALWPQMEAANRLIREYCAGDKRLVYVDVASAMLDARQEPRKELFQKDDLHMTRAGYEVWRDVLKPILIKTELSFEAGGSKTGAAVEGTGAQPDTLVYTNWPFDQAEARGRQKETSTQLGWPEQKTIALPGGESLELVLVPAGEFVMGRSPAGTGVDPTSKEVPHRVRISRPFYLGKTEFSQGQWQAVTGANPGSFTNRPDRARLPVDSVSYTAIQDALLPRLQPLAPAGWRFRLPTEAEWEYACRAGAATAFAWGADIATDQARFSTNEPAACGQFPANAWGLHDMHGNLWEWCLDWKWDSIHTNSPIADPVNVNAGWSRVVRGGSWSSGPEQLDAAFRGSFNPDMAYITRYLRGIGFRLALIPDADRDPVSLAAAAAAKAPPPALGGPALFQDGDRVCFVGDSITRGGGYHTFIRLYYLTRFPERDVRFFNCGISGDNANRAYKRVDWDVAPHRPTVCALMFGMNDLGKYSNYGRDTSVAYRRALLEEYYTKLSDLAGRLTDLTPRLVFLTSSPFDEVVTSPTPVYAIQVGRNLGLAEGAKTVASMARRAAGFLPASYVDFFTPMNAINEERQKTDKSFTVVSPDRVHPGPVGHFVMAYTFLKAQGAPGLVSRLAIDAAGKKIEAAENCEARELVANRRGITFQVLGKALPFAVPEEAAPALELVPFTADFNRELLTVKGLAPGRYRLSIDGQVAGAYASEELAAGLNLATNPATPQYQQAMAVLATNAECARIANDLLRNTAFLRHFVLPDFKGDWSDFAAVSAAVKEARPKLAEGDFGRRMCDLYLEHGQEEDALRRQVTELEETMRRINKPTWHRYELAREP